jgi:glutamate--cysteine ligase
MHAPVMHDIRPLSEREAEVYVASTCFKTGPPRALGVEIERLLYDEADASLQVPANRVREALATANRGLPCGGLISLEPGGQLELSSLPAPDLRRLIDATRTDLRVLERDLEAAGLRPSGEALDAIRPPVRSLHQPRYAAMQRYFDRRGPVGRTMMCSTAAVQVCLDAGLPGTGLQSSTERWERLHRLIPVLIAMFANSPFRDGAPNGWRCNRQAVWMALDPQRTRPPTPLGDPRQSWSAYALDAEVLCIRSPGSWEAPRGLTMRGWLRGEGPRPVILADLDYHLTTLFPPVRPRGFFELRIIDAQPGSDWEVPLAVVAALMEDDRAAELATAACPVVDDLPAAMVMAARDGLADSALAEAAAGCAKAAIDALESVGADQQTCDRVTRFAERYTARGRSPADDRLDGWLRTGEIRPVFDEETR